MSSKLSSCWSMSTSAPGQLPPGFQTTERHPSGVIPCLDSELDSLNTALCLMEFYPPQEHGLPVDHRKIGTATSPTGTALKMGWTPPFTISLSHHPWCPLPSWKANHNLANVHNKAPASHQTAQHLSRNLKMRPCNLVSAWGRSSVEGLGVALPKTTSWWLAKRIFLFLGCGFFPPSLLLTCIRFLQWIWNANSSPGHRAKGISSGWSLWQHRQLSAAPPIWNSTWVTWHARKSNQKLC